MMMAKAKRPGRVRKGQLVGFRLPVDLVRWLDEAAEAQHTNRSQMLIRLLVWAKAGSEVAESEAAGPLFAEVEKNLEAMVTRAVADQRQRERVASIAVGGVVSSRSRRRRK